jgi:hypothetical protein
MMRKQELQGQFVRQTRLAASVEASLDASRQIKRHLGQESDLNNLSWVLRAEVDLHPDLTARMSTREDVHPSSRPLAYISVTVSVLARRLRWRQQ